MAISSTLWVLTQALRLWTATEAEAGLGLARGGKYEHAIPITGRH